ncbi:MAG: response regulator transcription factor [Dehalococcoidia bacterium]|nr:response regulator transcription factor [Dehalococcoidia bacterium]
MKFLIVDDAPDVVEAVSLCLELRYPGATIISAAEGNAALELFQREEPDLIVLDIGLPNLDGFDVCRQIRANSQVPIIMLTVRDRDVDVARGLAVGADDYITKPFSHIELLARVQSVLRRTKSSDTTNDGSFTTGDLVVNYVTREVWLKGKDVQLTPTEYRLLYQLVRNAGRVVTHQELLTRIWGPEFTDKTSYLKVHVQHLRQKLEDLADTPRLIHTEPGVGYSFRTPTPGVNSS